MGPRRARPGNPVSFSTWAKSRSLVLAVRTPRWTRSPRGTGQIVGTAGVLFPCCLRRPAATGSLGDWRATGLLHSLPLPLTGRPSPVLQELDGERGRQMPHTKEGVRTLQRPRDKGPSQIWEVRAGPDAGRGCMEMTLSTPIQETCGPGKTGQRSDRWLLQPDAFQEVGRQVAKRTQVPPSSHPTLLGSSPVPALHPVLPL